MKNVIVKIEFIFILLFVFFKCSVVVAQSEKEKIDDKVITWYDCSHLQVEGKGWTSTKSFYDRLPAKAEGIVRKPIWELSHKTAGLYYRFITDSPQLYINWTLTDSTLSFPHMPATCVSGVDIYGKSSNGKWIFVGNGKPKSVLNSITVLGKGFKEFILYLPLYNGIKSISIGIDKGFKIVQPETWKRKPVVFYGTSITQGGCASRPCMAVTSMIGRRMGVPVINLGFSGNGRMEIELADLLSELKCGSIHFGLYMEYESGTG